MREKEIEMTSYVFPGKTPKRVVQNVVFLLVLGFAALAYVATPLTTFAACSNNNKTNTQKKNSVAVLMGKQRLASLRKGDKVRVKIGVNGNFRINGKSKILQGVYLGNRKVSVVTMTQGKRQPQILPLLDPSVV